MSSSFDRITKNPEIMKGQVCKRGMRFTVGRVLEAAARSTRAASYSPFDRLRAKGLSNRHP
ncbi:MAG: DUF433 domain-containing protein [Gammaproteobacteria bacterium]|nr:DUF433 domain-containing protein [Gammaproteobacteria bacterium]